LLHENAIFLLVCPPGMTRIAGHGTALSLDLMGCQKVDSAPNQPRAKLIVLL